MLYNFLRVAIDDALEPTMSWRHFKAEVAYRFRDEPESEERKEVEKAALGRWILILLAGIPCQTIKLLAMRGIPWTQAMAMMYFLSLIFGETISMIYEATHENPRTPGATPDPAPNAQEVGKNLPSDTRPGWLKSCKIAIYVLQAAVTFLVLSKLPSNHIEDALYEYAKNSTVSHWEFKDKTVIYSGFLSSAIATYYVMEDDGVFFTFPPYVAFVTIVTRLYSHLGAIFGLSQGLFIMMLVLLGALLCISYVALITILFYASRGFGKTRVGRLLDFRSEFDDKMDLVGFLVNVVCTVVGYTYLFNETGTINPSWVGIFG
jgi:hypothetical protein